MKKIILLILALAIFIPVSDAQALKKVKEIKVKNVQVIDQGDDYVQVQWNQIKNARVKFAQVKAQRVTAKGKYKYVKRVKTKRRTVKKKIVTGLSAEKDYAFKVRACRTSKICGLWSDKVETTTDSEFLIKNLIVDFDEYDPETGRAGAFIFHGGLQKVFYEFLSLTDAGDKVLPTFEYIVADDANVYSPIDGKVTYVEYQDDSQDYEVHINPLIGDNQMTAGLDHVLNIQVEVGDTVTAGDVIGNPGTHSWDGYGRVEIEIFGDNYMHCPFEFFDPSTTDEYQQKVSQLMSDWETFRYDDTIYDQAAMTDYASGCLDWKY